MAKRHEGWSLGELASILNAELVGPADLRVIRPGPADTDDAEALAFAGDAKYLALAESSQAGAIIVSREVSTTKPHLKVDSPRAAFGAFLAMCRRELPIASGIHPTAVVAETAQVSPGAKVGAYAVIEEGAVIMDGARIYPFCFVGQDCVVGSNSTLYPHVVLMQSVTVGANSIIHSGTVLGSDGFGYVWTGEVQYKVPQVGGILVGDHVEIGAVTAIDRATSGNTVIGNGVKIDNLVQVAHNVKIGDHSVIASQVGIAGSTQIGSQNTVAGQVGFADHVSTTDNVTLGGRAGVTTSIEKPGKYAGRPAVPIMDFGREQVMMRKLPDLFARVKVLEAELERLRSKGE